MNTKISDAASHELAYAVEKVLGNRDGKRDAELDDLLVMAMNELNSINHLAADAVPVCEMCNGWGRIGGPSFYAPDEGGEPCPDCQATHPQPAALNEVSGNSGELGGYEGHTWVSDYVLAGLRERAAMPLQLRDGEVWHWQGDGHDFPESLACPVIMSADSLRCLLDAATGKQQGGEVQGAVLTTQQVYDRFGFLEGLVSEHTYRRIADEAVSIQQAALASRQPVGQGPKFTTEDGPCWHHAGKALIVTVDGDSLQLMVTDGPRIEFIGDARPFRVPAQGIDLGPLRRLYQAYVRLLESGRDRITDLGSTCDPVDVMERMDVDLIEARKLLGIKIDGRDAGTGVGP